MCILFKHLFIYIFLLCFLLSCGGGGGGESDFVGGANVSIAVRPDKVDTGDHVLLRTVISDVYKDGIALKFRYPVALSFVPESAYFEADGEDVKITPNYEEFAASGRFVYLVFFLTQPEIIENGAVVYLELKADSIMEEADISVDADINTGEFNVNEPQFSPQDIVSVELGTR